MLPPSIFSQNRAGRPPHHAAATGQSGVQRHPTSRPTTARPPEAFPPKRILLLSADRAFPPHQLADPPEPPPRQPPSTQAQMT